MAELKWSPKALRNLRSIFDYISIDSEENAHGFINKIVGTVLSIPDFPMSGRIVPEMKDTNIREKIFDRYRIIYRYEVGKVEIVTVIHSAKKLKKKDLI